MRRRAATSVSVSYPGSRSVAGARSADPAGAAAVGAGGAGIKNTALCPAFVDTPMTDFVKEHVAAETMITTADVAESVRWLLKTSTGCVVPEIRFEQPGGGLGLPA